MERPEADHRGRPLLADSRRSDIARCVTRHRSGRWVAGRGRHSPFRDDGNMNPVALDPGEFGLPLNP